MSIAPPACDAAPGRARPHGAPHTATTPAASTPARQVARHWPRLKRLLLLSFAALVLWLLVRQARNIDGAAVLQAFQKLPNTLLWGAALLSALSYTLYSSFDLLGRQQTAHRLGTPTVLGITAISYAFNLSLGTLIGGIAFRLRLYAQRGLAPGVISRVIGFSILTNWLGYLAVGGVAFLFWPPPLPGDWRVDASVLRWMGAAMLCAATAYLLACALARRRTWTLRGHALELASARMALLQLLMAGANWLLMAGVLWLLLDRAIAFPQVLAVLMIGAVAGVIAHVPAGLGVLEAVCVALLVPRLSEAAVLAGLLGYRVIYYLLPLALAAMAYGRMEWINRHRPAPPGNDQNR